MITESKLEALKFNKVVWEVRKITEYWLPLFEPTGDPELDNLSVRFNESQNEPGPMVYFGLRARDVQLPHIKKMSELIQLYELLAGHSFEVSDGEE